MMVSPNPGDGDQNLIFKLTILKASHCLFLTNDFRMFKITEKFMDRFDLHKFFQ